MKKVSIRRTEAGAGYTAGSLFIDGVRFCDTLEDECRDLNHNGRFDGGEAKVAGRTCIPCGTYRCTFEPTSLGIGRYARGGLIPLLHDVPSFSQIRIHSGNTPADTQGCILLGQKSGQGRISASRDTCLAFYEKVGYGPFEAEITDDFAR